jgi:hypothetical protein
LTSVQWANACALVADCLQAPLRPNPARTVS